MHGRVKVRRSAEQEKAEKAEKLKEIENYNLLANEIFSIHRSKGSSDKLLKLTENILEKSPSSYVFWNYRREVLLELFEKDPECRDTYLKRELSLTYRCLLNDPKVYSTWHHRSWCMLEFDSADWDAEVKLCNTALDRDERNFHCWDYRRFVVQKGNISSESEFSYTDDLIEKNFSNFSAWQYRGEILKPNVACANENPIMVSDNSDESKDVSLLPIKELNLVNNAIFTDPKDQSPWFYLWWILGHVPRKTYLREIYICRYKKNVTFVFTNPKLRSELNALKVIIRIKDSHSEKCFHVTETTSWQSVLGDVSSVWYLNLTDCIDDLDTDATVDVTVEVNNKMLTCFMQSEHKESLTRVEMDPIRLLNPAISPIHEPESLKDQLELVEDLLSMEPNNKWGLLTLISLTRYVSPPNSSKTIENSINKLIEIDYQRKRYYQDLASDYFIEDALSSAFKTNKRRLDLSNSRITRLSCLDWCSLMKCIDLSNNHLDSLPDTLAYLVCLEELNLDNNTIKCLQGVQELKCLKKLSICNNRLEDFDAIEAVMYCKSLTSLLLSGNKVASSPNLTQLLTKHPHSKNQFSPLNILYCKSE